MILRSKPNSEKIVKTEEMIAAEKESEKIRLQQNAKIFCDLQEKAIEKKKQEGKW